MTEDTGVYSNKPPVERRRSCRRALDYQADHFHSIFTSFEQVGRHVLLLNGELRVLYRSSKIDELLGEHAVSLHLEPKFCLGEPHNAKQFQIFWDGFKAFQLTEAAETAQSCLLLLERPTASPLLLSCFPLPDHNGEGAKILAVLSDPGCVSESQWRAFQTLFSLTAAELRLCLALADGLSLAEYGQKYQVTDNTARSQLKSIFTKTNTRRQGDLVRLIFLLTRL